MSTQGQGDVVARLEARERTYLDRGGLHYYMLEDAAIDAEAREEITRLRALLSSSRGEQGWRTMDSAPKDGTHIIGNTQWGAREIWWHKDTYEGEYWTDEGDSEPEPTGWIPMPGSVPTSLAGQGPDGWDRIIATLREFSSLRAADGDYWEADAADRAAKEIERIPPVNRPALQSSPQPTAGGDAPK